MKIRDATPLDAEPCARIYAPHVEGSAVSFEAEAPTPAEMARRIARIQATHLWLVAELDDRVLGYAYAGPFRDRAAYDRTCESTVYVGTPRRGVGRALMTALIDRVRARGFAVVIAGVTLPNEGSVQLHERLGFVACGRFPRVGHKLGAWHDVGFWALDLGASGSCP